MIRIEDFKTIDQFKIFIIDYLKKNKILSKFKRNLSKYPISCSDIYNYIGFFYLTKKNLEYFFIYSFNWKSSPEGDDYWYDINRNFDIYITNNTYYDDCWFD